MKRKNFIVDVIDKPYRVIYDDTLGDDGDHGKTVPGKCRIGIDTTQHPSQLRDTVWHEVMHAAFYEGGLTTVIPEDEKEETLVRILSTITLYVLRRNPELVDLLLEEDA